MKNLLITILFLSISFIYTQAQSTDKMVSVNEMGDINGKVRASKFEYALLANPTVDKIAEYSITGIGTNTFSVSNRSNGTNSATQPEQKIVLELLTNNKNDKIELIFFSNSEGMITVGEWKGVISVYYPLSWYESIKQKLDQSILIKKKANLKVKILADGNREGQLIF